MPRVKTDGGYVNPARLPKGAEGRALCRHCQHEVPVGRRSFCSDECVNRWKLDHNPSLQRSAVFDRDRGVCCECGVDTEELKRRWRHARNPRGSQPWVGYPAEDEPRETPEMHRSYRFGTEEETAHRALWADYRERLQVWRLKWRALEDEEHAHARQLGFPSASGHLWEMDHVREVARGQDDGRFDPGNLVTRCVPCHRRKTRAFAAERARLRKAGLGPDGKPVRLHRWVEREGRDRFTGAVLSRWTECVVCGVVKQRGNGMAACRKEVAG